MQIPNQFTLIKWLKEPTVALVVDQFGRKKVLKENQNAKILEEFSQLVTSYTKLLREIMPKLTSESIFLDTHVREQKYTFIMLIHDFIEGELAGDTTLSFGIKKENFSYLDPKIISRSLLELQNLSSAQTFLLPKSVVPSINQSKNKFRLEERNSSFYLSNIGETKSALEKEIGKDFWFSLTNFLSRWAKTVDQNTNVLANGDLQPENLIVKGLISGQAKNFMLSDWDLLHFDNPGFDLADLYVWSWRNREWRQILLAEFKASYQGNQDELAVCLRFCQVYLSCQMIKHVYLMREKGLNDEAKENAEGLLESSKELLKINL